MSEKNEDGAMSQEEINNILNGQTPQGGAAEPPAAEPAAAAPPPPAGEVESTALSQDDIDAMLNGQAPDDATAVEPPAAEAPAAPAPAGELNQADIDAMMGGGADSAPAPTELNQDDLNNMLADAGIEPEPPAPKVEVGDFSFGQIESSAPAGISAPPDKLDMIMDISVQISVELGRTRMPIKNLLNLVPGSVVELDKLAGDPLDIFVNDSLVAKGKVVVVDENFGIRITDLVSKEDRIKTLK